jgi:hypothetical protein
MAELQDNLLPPTFNRLAWSNLAAGWHSAP